MVLWRQDWCVEVTTMKSQILCSRFVTIHRCEMIPTSTGMYNPPHKHRCVDCCWNILQQTSLLLRTKHKPSSVLEKSPAGKHKWTIIVHIKDTLFDAHGYQAVKIDLNKRSVSFSMSIGPVWPLIPFLNWFTPSADTTDKGQTYNLKWQALAVFVPLSAWINHFHLKSRGLMLWVFWEVKLFVLTSTGSPCGLSQKSGKQFVRAGGRENQPVTFILCL